MMSDGLPSVKTDDDEFQCAAAQCRNFADPRFCVGDRMVCDGCYPDPGEPPPQLKPMPTDDVTEPIPDWALEEARDLHDLLAADGYQPNGVDHIARALLSAAARGNPERELAEYRRGVRKGDSLRRQITEARQPGAHFSCALRAQELENQLRRESGDDNE